MRGFWSVFTRSPSTRPPLRSTKTSPAAGRRIAKSINAAQDPKDRRIAVASARIGPLPRRTRCLSYSLIFPVEAI